jgi:DNA/RNA endonuclease G (NUC1)
MFRDSVKVWCGSVGVERKINRVSIPTKCWKVLYIVSTKEYYCYIFDNNTTKPDGLDNNKVSIEEIEKLTNLKFKIK